MTKWFRWYEGTCEDGKFRLVASNAGVTVATVMGVWAALLEDAAHPEHRGECKRGKAFYCAILDISDEDMNAIIGYMDDAKLVTIENDEISITKWKERQFETDGTDPTNADRQRRFREKQKANKTETGVTPLRNGSITAAKRPDTDTDTDKNNTCPVASATRTKTEYDEKFEEAWRAYPRRDGGNPKSPSAKLFLAAVKAGEDPAVIIDGIKKFALAESRNVGTPYIPQMKKWLRDKRWLDYLGEQAAIIKFDVRKHLV